MICVFRHFFAELITTLMKWGPLRWAILLWRCTVHQDCASGGWGRSWTACLLEELWLAGSPLAASVCVSVAPQALLSSRCLPPPPLHSRCSPMQTRTSAARCRLPALRPLAGWLEAERKTVPEATVTETEDCRDDVRGAFEVWQEEEEPKSQRMKAGTDLRSRSRQLSSLALL